MKSAPEPVSDKAVPVSWRVFLLLAAIVGLLAVAATVGARYYNPPAAGDRSGVLVHPWDDTISADERARRWCRKQGGEPKFVKVEKSGGWVYRCIPRHQPVPAPLLLINYAAAAMVFAVPILFFVWWRRNRRN